MANDLAAITQPSFLAGTIKAWMDQSKNRQMTKLFAKNTKSIMGDIARWHTVPFPRGPAPIVGPHDTAEPAVNLGVEERTHTMITILRSKQIYIRDLMYQGWPTSREGYGLTLIPDAPARVADELRDIANQIGCTVEIVCSQLLTTGNIKISPTTATGYIVIPGSRLKINTSVDGVQSLTGGGAYWSSAATHILTDTTASKPSVYNFKKQMREIAGLEAGEIWLQTHETASLRLNTEVQNVFRGSVPGAPVEPVTIEQIADVLRRDNIVFREYNGTWVSGNGFVSEGARTYGTGTAQYFIPSGTAFCTPAEEDFSQFVELHEGYLPVPNGEIVAAMQSVAGPLNVDKLYRPVPGLSAFAVYDPKPPGIITVFAQYTFFPVLKFGEALITAKTDS